MNLIISRCFQASHGDLVTTRRLCRRKNYLAYRLPLLLELLAVVAAHISSSPPHTNVEALESRVKLNGAPSQQQKMICH